MRDCLKGPLFLRPRRASVQYRQTGGSDARRRDSEHSSEAKLLKINIYISMFNSTKLIKYRRDNVIRSREIYHLPLDNHYSSHTKQLNL